MFHKGRGALFCPAMTSLKGWDRRSGWAQLDGERMWEALTAVFTIFASIVILAQYSSKCSIHPSLISQQVYDQSG